MRFIFKIYDKDGLWGEMRQTSENESNAKEKVKEDLIHRVNNQETELDLDSLEIKLARTDNNRELNSKCPF